MEVRWREGLPARLVAKILRKAGIHPWSLLLRLDAEAQGRLAGELRIPAWFREACLQGRGELRFRDLPGVLRIPEHLHTYRLRITRCPGLKRMPCMLWVQMLELEDCRGLEWVGPMGGARIRVIRIEDCPHIRGASLVLDRGGTLQVRRCGKIRFLPTARMANLWWLQDLPSMRRIQGRAWSTHLFLAINLPRLETVEGLKVHRPMQVKGCPELRLPEGGLC
jgi:hypothetical protein